MYVSNSVNPHPCVSSVPGQCRVSPIPALLSFQNRSHQALSICEYSKTADVKDVEIWVAPVQTWDCKREAKRGCMVGKKEGGGNSMGWFAYSGGWPLQDPTSCVCLIFLHCVLLDVSSTGLSERIYRHIGCIGQRRFETAWAGLLTAVADHCRTPLTICSPIIDFGPDGNLITGSVLAHIYLAMC